MELLRLTINNSNNLFFQQTLFPETPQMPVAAGWLHRDTQLHCFMGLLST